MNTHLPTTSRRQFLSAAALGAVSCAAATSLSQPATAIEPIPRNGQSKFKFSLAAYSYRSLLQKGKDGTEPTATLTDFINDCAKLGCDGTELTSYYFPKAVTHDYLRSLRRQCFRLGLDVSGTAIGNDFGFPPGEERTKQIALTKQWIDFAEILGAPVIRIFAGHVKKDSTPAATHSLMVSGIEECCEYAGQHGVHLALENHGGPTATADGLLQFVRDVNSPWFGVNVDSGNFHSDDPYRELEQIAPYALNMQVKVVMTGPDKKKVPADYKRLAKIMRDANYRGYVVLEYEEAGNVREECAKHFQEMKAAFA
ncbi:L-ribulose-5-phosphate 3-epimerase UlaE [Anatilimnocola aggregata]|uniref:L-ribulose-5-phosphate 3-epimerase UlaE n=1 Tax=Anatilimnocola aggregata TaxID=2528021 RepID=A0A517Y9D9_9BACT|nr:TIM barrel protein [Anatilimnocola aggregata]QDU26811.1 L-ribulose-5-phosphate 3-epimerase UlaE [Anatilimnocola aggregata]